MTLSAAEKCAGRIGGVVQHQTFPCYSWSAADKAGSHLQRIYGLTKKSVMDKKVKMIKNKAYRTYARYLWEKFKDIRLCLNTCPWMLSMTLA